MTRVRQQKQTLHRSRSRRLSVQFVQHAHHIEAYRCCAFFPAIMPKDIHVEHIHVSYCIAGNVGGAGVGGWVGVA